jgi:hypothetical protein
VHLPSVPQAYSLDQIHSGTHMTVLLSGRLTQVGQVARKCIAGNLASANGPPHLWVSLLKCPEPL